MCEAAIMVYKQTILPIFYYAGFLLISLNNMTYKLCRTMLYVFVKGFYCWIR